jgi:hypothetical protein
MNEMAKQIAEEACRRYPAYNNLVEVLGIDGSLQAMEALAELMTYMDTNHSWTKIRNYLGLWKRDRKNRYHKSKTARQALERLTITIKGYGVKGRDLEEALKTIWTTLRTQKAGEAEVVNLPFHRKHYLWNCVVQSNNLLVFWVL